MPPEIMRAIMSVDHGAVLQPAYPGFEMSLMKLSNYEYGGPEKLLFEEDVPGPSIDWAMVRCYVNQTAATSVNTIDWKFALARGRRDFP